MITAIGSWLTLGQSSATTSTIPANVRAGVDFPLYYPRELPKGYVVDTESFSSTDEVVTFNINYDDGSKLIVSQQPIPAIFNFDAFYQKTMRDSLSITTLIGEAKIGSMNGTQMVSLKANKTWILISAPGGAEIDTFQAVVKSFRLATSKR